MFRTHHWNLQNSLIDGADHIRTDAGDPVAAANLISNMNDVDVVILHDNRFHLAVGLFDIPNRLEKLAIRQADWLLRQMNRRCQASLLATHCASLARHQDGTLLSVFLFIF
jgi:hypothetical protein